MCMLASIAIDYRRRPDVVSRRIFVAAIVLLTFGAVHDFAQFQVNNQTRGRVNNVLYTSGKSGCINFAGTPGGIHAKSSMAMNSELRHAYAKSGAMPSDIRHGYAKLGPMDPRGGLSYIDYKPDYLNKQAPPSGIGAA